MKYEAMSKLTSKFSVVEMCKVLGVGRENYYRWVKDEKKRERKRLAEIPLVNKIEEIFNESDRISGYRIIRKELEEQGYKISEYRVRKIMKENGFYPENSRKYKPSRNGKSDGKYYKNLLKQNFKTDKPNQVWVGDITYVKTNIGWVYLAVIIDLFNREVIGYAISKKMNVELVKQALANAIGRRGRTDGLVFHSDRGSQYSSKAYQKMLLENGFIGSMSRPGCPYDNSCVESFFASLKKEKIYRRRYEKMEEVRKDVFWYIEMFYNRKRRHSALEYRTPVE